MAIPGISRPEQLAEIIADFVGQAIEPLRKRIAELEQAQARTLADAYQGAHLAGREYSRGQLVTHHGGLWLALESGTDKPGDSGQWKLIVKGPR